MTCKVEHIRREQIDWKPPERNMVGYYYRWSYSMACERNALVWIKVVGFDIYCTLGEKTSSQRVNGFNIITALERQQINSNANQGKVFTGVVVVVRKT